MSILASSDFKNGRYRVALNPEQSIGFQEAIDYVEKYYLKRLFGIDLYNLFIADLALPTAGQPTAARFIKVFNAFDYQHTDDCIYSSEGIKEMLKGFVYFYWLRDLNKKVATTGTIKTKSSNSENISSNWAGATSRYNQAVDSFEVIQIWMDCFDSENYPEYKGELVERAYQF